MKIFRTLLISSLILASCSENDDNNYVACTADVTMPEGVETADLTEPHFTFTNLSDGRSSGYDGTTASAQLLPGLYDITFTATTTLENGVDATVRASKQAVDITSNTNVNLEAYILTSSDDLIISEIFFTGTQQTSGNSYTGDQYIKLYNNTDHTIYADGLTIFETLFLTTTKYDYTPDVMAEKVAVSALYTIPGSGKDHAVEPGKELLISDIAINHKELNPNSMDLSHADFEWYDESTNPKVQDTDNPDVPNLDKWYCTTKTVWTLHNRGFKGYGIARIPQSQAEYLADNQYTASYQLVTAAGTYPMTTTGYTIDNEWIVDYVGLSVEASYQWQVTAPSLDCGWAHCGSLANDATRYGKSVRRKVIATENGREILADTNNSTVDFISEATPSEMK